MNVFTWLGCIGVCLKQGTESSDQLSYGGGLDKNCQQQQQEDLIEFYYQGKVLKIKQSAFHTGIKVIFTLSVKSTLSWRINMLLT